MWGESWAPAATLGAISFDDEASEQSSPRCCKTARPRTMRSRLGPAARSGGGSVLLVRSPVCAVLCCGSVEQRLIGNVKGNH